MCSRSEITGNHSRICCCVASSSAQAPATHIQLRGYLSIPIVRVPPVAHANAKEEEKIKQKDI
jgi:hypothetical protein